MDDKGKDDCAPTRDYDDVERLFASMQHSCERKPQASDGANDESHRQRKHEVVKLVTFRKRRHPSGQKILNETHGISGKSQTLSECPSGFACSVSENGNVRRSVRRWAAVFRNERKIRCDRQ